MAKKKQKSLTPTNSNIIETPLIPQIPTPNTTPVANVNTVNTLSQEKSNMDRPVETNNNNNNNNIFKITGTPPSPDSSFTNTITATTTAATTTAATTTAATTTDATATDAPTKPQTSSEPDYNKASVATLIYILKDIAFYLYIEKPLSENAPSNKDQSYTSTFLSGLTSLLISPVPAFLAEPIGIRKRPSDQKHHMLDNDFEIKKAAWNEFISALLATTATNTDSQMSLLSTLNAIHAKLAAGRFKTHFEHLAAQFMLADKANDKQTLTLLIQAAQKFYAPAPNPTPAESNDWDYIQHIKYGHMEKSTTISTIRKTIDYFLDQIKSPDNAPDTDPRKNKYKQYNYIDATITVARINLDDHTKSKDHHNVQIIHQLHEGLKVLQLIYGKIGVPDNQKAYDEQIKKEQEILQHYHSHKKYPQILKELPDTAEIPLPPSKTLPEIAQSILDRTVTLNFLLGEHKNLASDQQRLDPHNAEAYTNQLGNFVKDPRIKTTLDTLNDEMPNLKGMYDKKVQERDNNRKLKLVY